MNLINTVRDWLGQRKKAAALAAAVSTAVVAMPEAEAKHPQARLDSLVGINGMDHDFLAVGTFPYGGNLVLRDIVRTDYPTRGSDTVIANFLLTRIETPQWKGLRLGLEQQYGHVATDPGNAFHKIHGAVLYTGQIGPVGIFSETAATPDGAWEQVLFLETGSGKTKLSLEGVATMQGGETELLTGFARTGYQITKAFMVGAGLNSVSVREKDDSYTTRWLPGAYVQVDVDQL